MDARVPLGTLLAVVIASMALLFTIGSFRWLHSRRGRLVTYQPQAFGAGVASGGAFVLRLPLVIFNSGARTEIVLDLRVRFHEDPAFMVTWSGRSAELDQLSDTALPSPFAIEGRHAVKVVAEFVDEIPGVALDRRVYLLGVDARIGDRWQWETLAEFDLHAENVWQLPAYVPCLNRPVSRYPPSDASGDAALAKVRRQYGAP